MAVDERFFEQSRAFVTETIRQVIPDANVDGGSAINAILGRGAGTIGGVLHQEIEHLLNSRSLSDPDAISDGDMDLLLANLLVTRDNGSLSSGFVRLFYGERRSRTFGAGLRAATDDGAQEFETVADLAFQPEDHFVDDESGQFFVNVPFVSSEPGEDFNIEPGEITQLLNDTSGALRVTNVSRFVNGRDAQDNASVLRSAQRAVSTRTPLSRDGVSFFMEEKFGPRLRNLLVIGNGDEEMLRDELHDMGVSASPRFAIGVDAVGGTPLNVHVGGRTDAYMLFESVNYIQQHVDIFADMTGGPYLAGAGTVAASIVTGTSGTVAATGKLIIDIGKPTEETVSYSLRTTVDGVVFTFTLDTPLALPHNAGATVKAVNNSSLSVGPSGDITILPVFKIAEVRLLDPLTFQPIGSSLKETSASSRDPGWYVTDVNVFDFLSAKETKTLVIDEKKGFPGNDALSGTGTLTSVVIGSAGYTRLVDAGADFTGYQGRDVTIDTSPDPVVKTILDVVNETTVVLSGAVVTGTETYSIDDASGDFSQFPIRVSYYTNTEIEEAQEFFDQDSKRVVSSDILARAFMPMFIDFRLRYRGNGTPSLVRDNISEVLKTSADEAIGDSSTATFDYSDLINAAYENGHADYVSTPFEVRVRRVNTDGTVTTKYVNPGADTVNSLAVRLAPAVTYVTANASWTAGTSVVDSSTTPWAPADVGRRIFFEASDPSDAVETRITAFNSPSQVVVGHVFNSTASSQSWSFPAYFLEAKRPASVALFNPPASGTLRLGGFSANQETVEYVDFTALGDDYTFVVASGSRISRPHPVDEPLSVSRRDFDPSLVISDGVITDERLFRPFFGEVVIEQLT